MNEQIVTETRPPNQHRPQRAIDKPAAKSLAVWNLYEWLRRPGDPDFEQLTRRQQLAFLNAFLIGAGTVDVERVMDGRPRWMGEGQ